MTLLSMYYITAFFNDRDFKTEIAQFIQGGSKQVSDHVSVMTSSNIDEVSQFIAKL